MSETLGYETVMRINGTSPVLGEYAVGWHHTIVSAAGPVFTFIQALLIFFILRLRGWSKYLYPLLFTPLYMRALAGFMNIIHPNDEGRIGQALGIGTYTLSILLCLLLFYLVYRISSQYALGRKFQLLTLLAVMVISSVLILFDQFYPLVLL